MKNRMKPFPGILKRLAACLLLLSALAFLLPAAASGLYTVTVTYLTVPGNPGAVLVTNENEANLVPKVVTYKLTAAQFATTQLGMQGTVAYTDEGLYKARPFIGWARVGKSQFNLSADNDLYSANNSLLDVLGSPKNASLTLYATYDGVFSHWAGGVPVPNQNFNMHRFLSLYENVTTLAQAEAVLAGGRQAHDFTSETYYNTDPALAFAPTDRGYTQEDKTLTLYYRPQPLNLPLMANFNMNRGVRAVVRNNQWIYTEGFLNQSEITMTFNLPAGVTVPQQIKSLLFNSYVFRAKDVKAYDAGGNEIPLTFVITKSDVSQDVIDVTLSAARLAVSRVTVIAEPKNRNLPVSPENAAQNARDAEVMALKATDFLQDMRMTFPPNGNAQIDSALARSMAVSGNALEFTGTVDGKVVGSPFPIIGSYPRPFATTNSNSLFIKFIFPKVTFDKNTAYLGDTGPQTHAADVPAMEESAGTLFVGSLMPLDPAFAPHRFLGWNTKRDGSGQSFTSLYDVWEDMVVYAQWDPVFTPVSVPLAFTKELKNGSLKAGQFTFVLKDAAGKELARVKNDAQGKVVFPERAFSRVVSNYLYTVSEVPGQKGAVTYDKAVYTVKVTTSIENGALKAAVNYEKDGTPYAGKLVFTNLMQAPKTGDSALLLPLALLAGALLLLGLSLTRRKKA